VQGASAPRVRHDRLKDFFAPTLQLHHGRVQDRRWQWDGRKQRAIKQRDFGQTVLFTEDLGSLAEQLGNRVLHS
jgi:hypothetical protein